MALLHQDMRRDILDGKRILYRLADGEGPEEPFDRCEVRKLRPKITGDDFILGTEHTLPYLCRLDALPKCIRHPQSK